MKNIYLVIFIVLVLFVPLNVKANERVEVELSSCVDGDTARFIMNKQEIKVRFLAIDTPETSHPTKGEEPYGKEAKDYTCNTLKNSKLLELEFDNNSAKKDKYDRYLAWVFVDNSLLQKRLVTKGLAKVAYIYDDYKYTDILKIEEEKAKIKNIGMYNKEDTSYYTNNKFKSKFYDKIKDIITDFFKEILEEILD